MDYPKVKVCLDTSEDKNKFIQFDVYYCCALIGMAAGQIDEDTSELKDLVERYPVQFYNDLTPRLNGWHGREGEYVWRMSLFANPKQSAIVRIVRMS